MRGSGHTMHRAANFALRSSALICYVMLRDKETQSTAMRAEAQARKPYNESGASIRKEEHLRLAFLGGELKVTIANWPPGLCLHDLGPGHLWQPL